MVLGAIILVSTVSRVDMVRAMVLEGGGVRMQC